MRRIRNFCFILGFLAGSLASQAQDSLRQKKEYYLQTSRQQKKVAWILLGSGSALIIGGAIAFSNQSDISGNTPTTLTATVVIIGILADLASIPFFLSAHHNKEMAASLSFGQQQILVPAVFGMAMSGQPSVSLKIPLSFH